MPRSSAGSYMAENLRHERKWRQFYAFDPLVVVAVGVWGTTPNSTIAALTALGLSVAAANAALGAALESIAHDSMLISRLRHSSPTRWRGA